MLQLLRICHRSTTIVTSTSYTWPRHWAGICTNSRTITIIKTRVKTWATIYTSNHHSLRYFAPVNSLKQLTGLFLDQLKTVKLEKIIILAENTLRRLVQSYGGYAHSHRPGTIPATIPNAESRIKRLQQSVNQQPFNCALVSPACHAVVSVLNDNDVSKYGGNSLKRLNHSYLSHCDVIVVNSTSSLNWL